MSKLYPISTTIIYSLMLINYLCAMVNNGNNNNDSNGNSTAMICCSAFSNWPSFGGVGPVCDPNC